jgi:ferredoxin--NADP+ reductase
MMQAAGQDVEMAKKSFVDSLPKAIAPVSQTRLRFEFLASPVRILGDWMTGVTGLKIEENTLFSVDGTVKARGLGTTRTIEADTVVFAIGDTVDRDFCVPTYNDAYVVVPQPRFPVGGISFEAYDPDAQKPLDRVFLGGWARQASTGLVGVARRDGENAAEAMLQYLHTQSPMPDLDNVVGKFEQRLIETHERVVDKGHLEKLEAAEQAEAQKLGREDFKFATNDEMLTAMGF